MPPAEQITPHRNRLKIAVVAVAIILSPALGAFAAYKAPKLGVATVIVKVTNSKSGQPLSGVRVQILSVGSPAQCPNTIATTDGSGKATFTKCPTSSTGVKKYVVSNATLSGYSEGRSPNKIGSGRFNVKTGRTATARVYLSATPTGGTPPPVVTGSTPQPITGDGTITTTGGANCKIGQKDYSNPVSYSSLLVGENL